jgi:flagellar hook-associated protein 1 FlgK
MSLSTALNIAQNSLLNTQRQTSVVARNISDAQNGDYSRRSAHLSSMAPGARVAEIRRATDEALFKQNMSALSGWTAQSTILDGLEQLSVSVNSIDNASSAATMLGNFQRALEIYSATPSNRTLAENAVESARQLVRSLNEGSTAIQTFRADMDTQIEAGVFELNALLADFEAANNSVKKGEMAGKSDLDALDRRDALLKRISEYVPISTITRPNNDVMIVTADGATLFETTPRAVSFESIPAYGPNTTGNRILVDGVPISPANGANTTAGGKLAAMVQLRDTFATGMQTQLDEVARGLIDAFSETDPNPPNTTVLPGLFTWPDDPLMPAAATVQSGLALSIRVNALMDPIKGGDPELLRDGANFDFNTDEFASFSDRLNGYLDAMDTQTDYVTVDGVVVTHTLMTYSTAAVSWFEDLRRTSEGAAENKSALMIRTQEALINKTGVNTDEEIALMLELEQSYAASAKMMQLIDEMLETLLGIVR